MVDVMNDTGPPGFVPGANTDVTTLSNGTAWYYGMNKFIGSMGFAKAGDSVVKGECDTSSGGSKKHRLCWHLSDNVGGFRCGEETELNNSKDWQRMVFVRN